MKFTVLAIATLTSFAAALLIPEDKKHHVIYSPVGAPHHPEHKLGHLGKPREGNVEVLPSADGDNFKVIKIVPDHHSHHGKPAPIPIKLESRPFKIDHKFDHKGDHRHDHKPCPYHKHEYKPEHKPCSYHKIEHKHDNKPCPYQKPEHKHEHKLYPIEKLDRKPDCKHGHKHEHKPQHPRPEHPKPEPQPTLEGECSPGTYECTFNPKSGTPGWKVCSSSGKWEYGGDCPPNTVCKYYAPSKSPYCVPRYYEFP